MTNAPSLTSEALRAMILEVVTEVVAKRPDTIARNVLPKADRERVDYDALAIKAFRKAGYGEIKPRIDTKTYSLWLAEGFKVKPGEHATKVKQLRLFHRSQVEMISAEEKDAPQGQSASELPTVSLIPQEPPKAKAPKASKKAPVVPIGEASGTHQ
jgi:hypothetical protein